jgi:parvulin-like peptidyl-prolyl isomerase
MATSASSAQRANALAKESHAHLRASPIAAKFRRPSHRIVLDACLSHMINRSGFMSTIGSLILGLIIVVFIIEFRPNANNPVQFFRTCVANVRGTCIDDSELRAQQALFQRLVMRWSAKAKANFKEAALDSLIERTLVEQEAERLGLRASAEATTRELVLWRVHVFLPASMRHDFILSFDAPDVLKLDDPLSRQAAGLSAQTYGFAVRPFSSAGTGFDQAAYDYAVGELTQQTTAEFEEQQRHEVLAAQMIALVESQVRVPEAEGWKRFEAANTTASYFYVRFPPEYFADRFVPVDHASLEKWAKDHAADVKTAREATPKGQEPREFKIRKLLVSVGTDKPAAAKRAQDLRDQIEKTNDFVTLAQKESADFDSKNRGGDVAWSDGHEWPESARVALAKMQPGELAVVDWNSDSIAVVQLVDAISGDEALVLPHYLKAKGPELAKKAADAFVTEARKRLPIALDANVQAKLDAAKKEGKSDSESRGSVVRGEIVARIDQAMADSLAGFTPVVVGSKADKTPSAAELALWRTDDRKPHTEETGTIRPASHAPPISTVTDPAIAMAAEKLAPSSPVADAVVVGTIPYVLVLRERHLPTDKEFQEQKQDYLAPMLEALRRDAVVNFIEGLRETASKDITMDSRFVPSAKASASHDEE